MTAVGFGLGALAGALWEEPGLMAGFVAGETEEVPWGSDRGLPEVAAEKPNARDATPPPPEAGRSLAEAAPPASGSRFAVQVGAFADSAAAERLAESLRGKGFRVTVSGSGEDGGTRWRVRVGPMETREAAERSAARLKTEETLPTWVLDEEQL